MTFAKHWAVPSGEDGVNFLSSRSARVQEKGAVTDARKNLLTRTNFPHDWLTSTERLWPWVLHKGTFFSLSLSVRAAQTPLPLIWHLVFILVLNRSLCALQAPERLVSGTWMAAWMCVRAACMSVCTGLYYLFFTLSLFLYVWCFFFSFAPYCKSSFPFEIIKWLNWTGTSKTGRQLGWSLWMERGREREFKHPSTFLPESHTFLALASTRHCSSFTLSS